MKKRRDFILENQVPSAEKIIPHHNHQRFESLHPFTGLQSLKRFKPLTVSVYRVPQMQGVGRTDDFLYFKCPTTKQMWFM